ncbi:hypothetical protein N9917_00145 [Deltaproteobacteria bacterium]|nr:hypothetical protein [Deltaproteobacteria bacterium]
MEAADWMDLRITPLVYVAGPFAAPNAAATAENVTRACALSLFAVTKGMSPIVPHPGIMAGAFGKEASSAERERGIRMVLVQVENTARAFDGRFWAIRKDDGGLSAGTHRELETFGKVYRERHGLDPHAVNAIVSRTWAEWLTVIPDEVVAQAGLPWQQAQVAVPRQRGVSDK